MPAPTPTAKPVVRPAAKPVARPTVVTGSTKITPVAQTPHSPAVPQTLPPFCIQTREDREKHKFLKLLVYGDYGVGKTFLAATASEIASMNDVLLLNAESGELTIDSLEKKLNAASLAASFEKIDTVPIPDYRTISEVFKFLKLHCKYRDLKSPEAEARLRAMQSRLTGVPAEQIKTPKRYRTAIIDSLSEVEAYCMNQLLGVSETTELHEEVASAEWSEYKKQHSMVQRLVRAYRDLPMHVVIICARSYIQDEQKRMLFSPALTGKLSSQVQGFMDMVGYYVLGNPKDDGTIPRRLYVQPVGKFSAKCRFSNYRGAYFDDPTMGSILQQVGLLKQ